MVMLIAMVIAAIVGFAASGEGGALAGARFGWLIVRSLRQQREIEALQKRAEPQDASPVPAPAPAVSTAAFVPAAPSDESPAPVAAVATMARSAAPMPAAAIDAPAVVAPARPIAGDGVPHPRPRDPLAPIKRWLFGGNTIVKAGVGILFIGLAFLAKYASEHAHLPVEVRLAAIGAAAVVLLGFGWRLRTSRPDYA